MILRRLLSGPSVLVALALSLASCNSIGPSSIPRDRVDYANALSDSWKDQMLLNIVRLRYSDAPTFLDVSSVISAYTMQAAMQAGGTLNLGTPNNSTSLPNATSSLLANGGYNDRPTISYTPLSGSKFAQSLLKPIAPEAIFSLIAAGYPVDMVLPVTVRALNGVYNNTTQAGVRVASDPQFSAVVEAWRRIQLSRAFSLRIQQRNGDQIATGVFSSRLDPAVRRDIELISRALNLKAENGEVLLDFGAVQRSANELAVLSRSMIEILGEFAANIDVPADHVTRGRTYGMTGTDSRSTFDRPRVHIYAGPSPPDDAFTAVSYRGTWYWISDGDIGTKRSLTFLLLFFSLSETGAAPGAPILTIPVQ